MKIEEAKKYILANYFDGMANVKEAVGGNEETMAMKLAVEAIEKQIPKKPLYEKTYGDCAVYSCPVCKDETMILNGDNYCTMCGQKLDWGGDDDEM